MRVWGDTNEPTLNELAQLRSQLAIAVEALEFYAGLTVKLINGAAVVKCNGGHVLTIFEGEKWESAGHRASEALEKIKAKE